MRAGTQILALFLPLILPRSSSLRTRLYERQSSLFLAGLYWLSPAVWRKKEATVGLKERALAGGLAGIAATPYSCRVCTRSGGG